jgi:XTP/dITP diphosphohydrolase
MKTIYLLTSNPGKVEEIKLHLKKFGIDVLAKDMEISEIKSDNQEDIAIEKVKFAAKKIKKSVIAEDTGIYFEAYKNFPGTNSRWIFDSLGYGGILKLLEGKARKAFFKTTVGFCEPNKEPKIFVGICRGEITDKPRGNPHPRLPYDAVFIPEGETRTFAEMTKEEKNKYSHRAKAVEKFAEWFVNV